MTDVVTVCEDCHKSYDSIRKRVWAVKGVDLELRRGEVVGLIGPNGAGKTTLLHCLIGFLRPSQGRITLFGMKPWNEEAMARTGFLSEKFSHYPSMTAGLFLKTQARLLNMDSAKAFDLMDFWGLDQAINRNVKKFSRGMLQRFGMVLATMKNPDLLILDEPTSGMDPRGRGLVVRVLADLAAKGKTILLSSHILHDVSKVCDRVLFMDGGRIIREENLSDDEITQMVCRFAKKVDMDALRQMPFIDHVEQAGHDTMITLLPNHSVSKAVEILASRFSLTSCCPEPMALESLFEEGA